MLISDLLLKGFLHTPHPPKALLPPRTFTHYSRCLLPITLSRTVFRLPVPGGQLKARCGQGSGVLRGSVVDRPDVWALLLVVCRLEQAT